MAERFVLVDVGCIECGEQTEVLGIFDTEQDVGAAFEAAAKARDIKNWEPRGGILEFLGLHNHEETTYLAGCGYFTGGQHALEVHVFPARKIPVPAPDERRE
jgi:hypothetical protein